MTLNCTSCRRQRGASHGHPRRSPPLRNEYQHTSAGYAVPTGLSMTNNGQHDDCNGDDTQQTEQPLFRGSIPCQETGLEFLYLCHAISLPTHVPAEDDALLEAYGTVSMNLHRSMSTQNSHVRQYFPATEGGWHGGYLVKDDPDLTEPYGQKTANGSGRKRWLRVGVWSSRC